MDAIAICRVLDPAARERSLYEYDLTGLKVFGYILPDFCGVIVLTPQLAKTLRLTADDDDGFMLRPFIKQVLQDRVELTAEAWTRGE